MIHRSPNPLPKSPITKWRIITGILRESPKCWTVSSIFATAGLTFFSP